MTLMLKQLEPTDEALRKGIHSLCQGDRAVLVSPPDRLVGTGPTFEDEGGRSTDPGADRHVCRSEKEGGES
jgi:hypothetical protein